MNCHQDSSWDKSSIEHVALTELERKGRIIYREMSMKGPTLGQADLRKVPVVRRQGTGPGNLQRTRNTSMRQG